MIGPGPFLAGTAPSKLRDIPLALLGLPMLVYAYSWITTAAVVDMHVLRRPVGYAKTSKDDRHGPDGDGPARGQEGRPAT